jgi:maleate isomerase
VRRRFAAAESAPALGKPVTSSNHALAWHCLRLAGVEEPLPQWGRLLDRSLTRG